MVNSREYEFRWNAWNVEHIAEHGVVPAEVEGVVRGARRPYPKYIGDGKWRVDGQATGGRYLRVIFIISPADTFYVIHAMNLSPRELKRYRRRKR